MDASEILELNNLWSKTDSETITVNVERVLSRHGINTLSGRIKKLAEVTNSSEHAVYAWLNRGRKNVKIPFLKLCEIAEAFQINIKDLLGGNEKMFTKKFAIMQTRGNDEVVLKFFGEDEYKAALAYGEELASGDYTGVLSCVSAMFDENGNILNGEQRVYQVWRHKD